MFLGRKEELQTLKRCFNSNKKTTILLYGRRRIGKTALIQEAIKEVNDNLVIYHEFHQITLEQNIDEFSSTVMKAFSLPSKTTFTTLSDAFSFISNMGRKAIVIMDEYSDLKIKADKGVVDSYMRTAIDNLSSNIKLVITGSILQTMEELLDEANPLFSRFSTIIKLQPLNYLEASGFFPNKSHKEQIELFSIFGGSPYVLSLLNENADLKENVEESIIRISGGVRAYIEAVIAMEVSKVPHGITILNKIKNGKKRYQELEDIIKTDAKGVLNKELTKLIDFGIIAKTQPINSNNKKKTFYEIKDPVIRFYFTYIIPNPSLLMSNPPAFYTNFIEQSIKDFIARRFEAVCREYFYLLVKIGKRNDILDIGSYRYDDKKNKKNGEFDIALKTIEGYEIYDAKFLSSPFIEAEAEKEKNQINELSLPITKWGVISTSGFEEKSNKYIQLTLDDLFFLS